MFIVNSGTKCPPTYKLTECGSFRLSEVFARKLSPLSPPRNCSPPVSLSTDKRAADASHDYKATACSPVPDIPIVMSARKIVWVNRLFKATLKDNGIDMTSHTTILQNMNKKIEFVHVFLTTDS